MNFNNHNNMNNRTVLVTGGTGFLAINTILQLLQQGFIVRTTLRSLNRLESFKFIKAFKLQDILQFVLP